MTLQTDMVLSDFFEGLWILNSHDLDLLCQILVHKLHNRFCIFPVWWCSWARCVSLVIWALCPCSETIHYTTLYCILCGVCMVKCTIWKLEYKKWMYYNVFHKEEMMQCWLRDVSQCGTLQYCKFQTEVLLYKVCQFVHGFSAPYLWDSFNYLFGISLYCRIVVLN